MSISITSDDRRFPLRNHLSCGAGYAVTDAVIVTLAPGQTLSVGAISTADIGSGGCQERSEL